MLAYVDASNATNSSRGLFSTAAAPFRHFQPSDPVLAQYTNVSRLSHAVYSRDSKGHEAQGRTIPRTTCFAAP